jgi:hypothetical protein
MEQKRLVLIIVIIVLVGVAVYSSPLISKIAFSAQQSFDYQTYELINGVLVLSQGDDKVYAKDLNPNPNPPNTISNWVVFVRLAGDVERMVVNANGDPVSIQSGTSAPLSIFALQGDDSVELTQANRAVHAYMGPGKDTVKLGRGQDYIEGGTGDDELHGNGRGDEIYGNDGDDKLFGGDDEDYIDGGPGNDNIEGNKGNDEIYGGSGDDDLIGLDGNDYLIGGAGSDNMNGGDGNDVLLGGPGNDVLRGDSGNNGQDALCGGGDDDNQDGGPDQDDHWGAQGSDTINDAGWGDCAEGQDGGDTINLGVASTAEGQELTGNLNNDVVACSGGGIKCSVDYLPGRDINSDSLCVIRSTMPDHIREMLEQCIKLGRSSNRTPGKNPGGQPN